MTGAALRALRRLGWALVVVFGVTSVSFVVGQLLPGDPARMIVGAQASAKDAAHVRELYELDAHVSTQFARYWTRMLHRVPPKLAERMQASGGWARLRGRPPPAARATPLRHAFHRGCAPFGAALHLDVGYSFQYRKPVAELLSAKIPRSVELAIAAMGVQLTLGLGIGLLAAHKRGTAWDSAAIGTALLGVSAPTFLLGLVLQYILAYRLRWLPYDGYGKTSAEHLRSLVLPALTLGIFGSALYARLVRDELATLLSMDFVRTARAKGASRLRALVVHALRNALLPLATLAVLDFGALVGGAIVTEKLFRWPGVGQMTVEALLNRDGPVIFGTVLFASLAVVLCTLALDLVASLLDPRLGPKEPS